MNLKVLIGCTWVPYDPMKQQKRRALYMQMVEVEVQAEA
jgi:hypothetical protein